MKQLTLVTCGASMGANVQGGPKSKPATFVYISVCQILTDFRKSFTGLFCGKFAANLRRNGWR